MPAGVPLFGASATLDRQTIEMVRDRCAFNDDTHLIRTPLDRPEIYLQVSQIQKAQHTMLDLQCLLPAHVEEPSDIPKTIIFMDSIQDARILCEHIQTWMKMLKYPVGCNQYVSPFFSDMAAFDKDKISRAFGRRAEECDSPRILVATDAYGLGIDNPDVVRVVQWLLPNTLTFARLYQRLGRAMRAADAQAHFILFCPPWAFGPRAGPSVQVPDTTQSADNTTLYRKQKPKRKDAERRRDLAPGLWDFINPDNQCIRRIGLRFFDDDHHRSAEYEQPYPCCSVCHPEAQVSTSLPLPDEESKERDPLRRPWMLARLMEWRDEKARARLSGSHLRYFPSLILPDAELELLATWAEYIHDETSFQRWVSKAWPGKKSDIEEILNILRRGQAMMSDRGEIFDCWVENNNKRAKRGVVEPSINQAQLAFEERKAQWLLNRQIRRGQQPKSTAGKSRMTKRLGQSNGSVDAGAPSSSQSTIGSGHLQSSQIAPHAQSSTGFIPEGSETLSFDSQASVSQFSVGGHREEMTQISTEATDIEAYNPQMIDDGREPDCTQWISQPAPHGVSPRSKRNESPRAPQRQRNPLGSLSPNIERDLPPSSSGRARKRPSRLME